MYASLYIAYIEMMQSLQGKCARNGRFACMNQSNTQNYKKDASFLTARLDALFLVKYGISDFDTCICIYIYIYIYIRTYICHFDTCIDIISFPSHKHSHRRIMSFHVHDLFA